MEIISGRCTQSFVILHISIYTNMHKQSYHRC